MKYIKTSSEDDFCSALAKLKNAGFTWWPDREIADEKGGSYEFDMTCYYDYNSQTVLFLDLNQRTVSYGSTDDIEKKESPMTEDDFKLEGK